MVRQAFRSMSDWRGHVRSRLKQKPLSSGINSEAPAVCSLSQVLLPDGPFDPDCGLAFLFDTDSCSCFQSISLGGVERFASSSLAHRQDLTLPCASACKRVRHPPSTTVHRSRVFCCTCLILAWFLVLPSPGKPCGHSAHGASASDP